MQCMIVTLIMRQLYNVFSTDFFNPVRFNPTAVHHPSDHSSKGQEACDIPMRRLQGFGRRKGKSHLCINPGEK